MSQSLRLLGMLLAFLAAITLAHGTLNLDWFEPERRVLRVGHLPVT